MKPTAWQTSVTVRLVARSRSWARSTRRSGEVRRGRDPVGRGEQPVEVVLAEPGGRGDRLEVERLGVVPVDVVARPAQVDEHVTGDADGRRAHGLIIHEHVGRPPKTGPASAVQLRLLAGPCAAPAGIPVAASERCLAAAAVGSGCGTGGHTLSDRLPTPTCRHGAVGQVRRDGVVGARDPGERAGVRRRRPCPRSARRSGTARRVTRLPANGVAASKRLPDHQDRHLHLRALDVDRP